jgi:lipopolysaccharide/colanic/teichoic acid biosynthesis glycosyltransferase
VTLLRIENGASSNDRLSVPGSAGRREVLNEDTFNHMIAVERKRTERTKQPFLLMLLETSQQQDRAKNTGSLESMVSALLTSIRETDVIGWYKDRTVIGVMYTGLLVSNKDSVLNMILNRASAALGDKLTSEQFSQVSISFHFFPDDWDEKSSGRPSNPALYPDLFTTNKERRSVVMTKRAMDIAGSTLMLLVCAPVFIAIAAAVKLSSKGPVFFRQQRVGQFGQHFTFLKFRSMRINNDHTAHKEFVTKFIASQANRQPANGGGEGVFKLTNDPRITKVGKFLRRTSLDELPQFLNVLKGEMSLVGPRPPIPYELAAYQTWHRRRVLEVKPGITGLWQVTGRSRVNFDEMVRLDLRYATTWSPVLDFTILLRTPLAVIKGEGAM